MIQPLRWGFVSQNLRSEWIEEGQITSEVVHGDRDIAAHPHTDQKFLSQANLSDDCCLVFGSEGYGLSPAVLAACDDTVAIPMPPKVDSLNVGSAAAVFLYEANRQRGTWGAARGA